MWGFSMNDKEAQNEMIRQKYTGDTNRMKVLINAVPVCPYSIDVEFRDIEYTLSRYNDRYEGGLHINPDFQRGHVWSEAQQISYIENMIRGAVGDTGRTITLTCSEFQHDRNKDCDIIGFYVIDGLQRLTAIRKFMNNEFKIFKHIDGGVNKKYFNGTAYRISGMALRFNVFSMQSKKEVLDYYISMNSGGTIHSEEEIERVKAMRDELI